MRPINAYALPTQWTNQARIYGLDQGEKISFFSVSNIISQASRRQETEDWSDDEREKNVTLTENGTNDGAWEDRGGK